MRLDWCMHMHVLTYVCLSPHVRYFFPIRLDISVKTEHRTELFGTETEFTETELTETSFGA